MTYAEAIQAIPRGTYRHFKGEFYDVHGIAEHSETGEAMVIYEPRYDRGHIFCRPADMWYDAVERDGRTYQRFELLVGPKMLE